MKAIAGREVSRAQFHVGAGHLARTGYDKTRDGVYMEVTPPGIYVRTKDGAEYLMPYSNVVWATLAPEDKDAK